MRKCPIEFCGIRWGISCCRAAAHAQGRTFARHKGFFATYMPPEKILNEGNGSEDCPLTEGLDPTLLRPSINDTGRRGRRPLRHILKFSILTQLLCHPTARADEVIGPYRLPGDAPPISIIFSKDMCLGKNPSCRASDQSADWSRSAAAERPGVNLSRIHAGAFARIPLALKGRRGLPSGWERR